MLPFGYSILKSPFLKTSYLPLITKQLLTEQTAGVDFTQFAYFRDTVLTGIRHIGSALVGIIYVKAQLNKMCLTVTKGKGSNSTCVI